MLASQWELVYHMPLDNNIVAKEVGFQIKSGAPRLKGDSVSVALEEAPGRNRTDSCKSCQRCTFPFRHGGSKVVSHGKSRMKEACFFFPTFL